MIVTRTPFRVTLGGGGTDLPSFYEQHGGFVLAMAIDKFMYVVLNVPNADRLVRLHYTNSETTVTVEELKHELAREAFRLHGIFDAVEVASVADLPAGSGLGSSSCYLVGLLTAIRAYLRRPVPLEQVAEEACHIELELLRKPIGKQDQYMATFGGLTALEIERDGRVGVRPIYLESQPVATLVANTHLYYTGVQRSATEVLDDQDRAMREERTPDRQRVEDSLLGIKEIGYRIRDAIVTGDFDAFGTLMDEHWQLKRRMSNKISISEVDALYEHVKREYGVLGGKVVGAGGGGFLMLYCPRQHKELAQFMRSQGMMRLHYNAEFEGAKVVTNVFNAHSLGIHGQGVL
ncbi:MAG TPA: galactokinase [Chloroflexota bacterium]|jgi:D-glycero-alpha-D-manno-heptose-7-phosphate kinase